VPDPAEGPSVDPFDVLVPVDPDAEPMAPADFRALCLWPIEGAVAPALFERTADPDSFLLLPDADADGSWRLLLEPAPGADLVHVATVAGRDAARAALQGVRATWRHLHEASEGAHLVEEVEFAPDGDDAWTPDTATLLLTGWTARTGLRAYRDHVARLAADLAPAHLHIRLRWLSWGEMDRLECLRAATPSPEGRRALRALLSEVEP
jgi:hypothetical protein